MQGKFEGSKLLITLTLITLITSFGAALTLSDAIYKSIPSIAYGFMIFWLALSIIFSIVSYREFVVGHLVTLFSMMIGWRIAALYDIHIIMYALLPAFIFLVLNFLYCAFMNVYYPDRFKHQISSSGWQLVFIRLYIGLNFIPHFTEKLFAGPIPHLGDVNAFISLGVAHPDAFVWLAGLCEFGAAVALGLGFFMRLGAFGAVLYLLIATYLGHHFSLGFIWAGPGGGWEFATMWMVLIFTYVFTGSHLFSIDQRIEDTYRVPGWLRKLM